MKVFLVLRSSPTYSPATVEWLRPQIRGVDIALITDVDYSQIPSPGLEVIPMRNRWPGWWSKMNLFDPDLVSGDVFFMDLDSVPLGSLAPFAQRDRTTMLSDFYRPMQLQSSLMYVTEADRRKVWAKWYPRSESTIHTFGRERAGFNGDQNFIQSVLGANVARWQDDPTTPVCSYKVDMVNTGYAPERQNEIIIFHGKPRPWDVGFPTVLE